MTQMRNLLKLMHKAITLRPTNKEFSKSLCHLPLMVCLYTVCEIRCGDGYCFRDYGVFSPAFKEPVSNKEEIQKLLNDTPEEEILTMKVKPALNSQTCSGFHNPDLEKLINYSMSRGNKRISREIVASALTKVKHAQLRKYNKETDEKKKNDIIINPLEIFLLAVKNVTPMLWYMRVRKSGTWYKIPVGVSAERARRIAMKWIVEAANEKDQKIPYKVQLANELLDAANYKGKAVSKKIELHKMCEANRGYVHYWWV